MLRNAIIVINYSVRNVLKIGLFYKKIVQCVKETLGLGEPLELLRKLYTHLELSVSFVSRCYAWRKLINMKFSVDKLYVITHYV